MTICRIIIASLLIVPLCLGLSIGDSTARSYVGLTADDVREVIGPQSRKVRRCYKRYAKKQRGVDGKVFVHLAVNPNGKVADVDVDAPTIRGKRFSRCVTKVAKRWRFPKASGGTDVTYPFRFLATPTRRARHSRHKRNRSRRR